MLRQFELSRLSKVITHNNDIKSFALNDDCYKKFITWDNLIFYIQST